MAISLHDATVAAFVQGLGGLEQILKKGAEHCGSATLDSATVLETRLHPDMLPLRYQVQAAIGHSVNAVEACRTGKFSPPYGADANYAGLQAAVADARTTLSAETPASIEALQGRDVAFVLSPERQMMFTTEGFLLSFSLPNFYFHVTTAYDILRQMGVPLGKKDYIGRPRLKA